jgi:hypothetical protein
MPRDIWDISFGATPPAAVTAAKLMARALGKRQAEAARDARAVAERAVATRFGR